MKAKKRQEQMERWASNFKKEDIPIMQARIETMISGDGGMLSNFAMRQPADFYIDQRVGKLRYPKRDIERAVHVLAMVAEIHGLDPHDLPIPNTLSYRLF
jgi:hypothetical protein